jgi:hypothetical protein
MSIELNVINIQVVESSDEGGALGKAAARS